MIWGDGTCFDGLWRNDERAFGKLVMPNNFVYIGRFVKDQMHGPNERVLMPNN